jgi:hyaluronoglucosaminidase
LSMRRDNMNASKQDFILGVVEGFYGVFYTFPERRDLIRFIGQHGYNLYVYAPKNDRQHRARWWEAYPPKLMAEFTETVQVAHQTGVQFCYAISPGGSLCYASEVDFQRVTSKLQAFFDIGVRSFSLMLDDLESKFRHPEDAQRFDSLAQAQADMANRLLRWLKILDPRCTLSFVPGEYSGRAPFSPTIHQLGALLDPAIDICYTGPEVCSPEITGEDARDFANAAGRPPIIWDNYPVNDLDMQPELHLAPVTGRSPDLLDHVKGILVNPMIQAEASKIPLWSYADYVADPRAYHPADSWETAVQAFAGADYAVQLRILAENTIVSCLGRGGQTLDTLSAAAVEALMKGRGCGAEEVGKLEAYLSVIDEAGYTLKFRLENLALRNELLPWIEIMEHGMWMARYSLQILRALENGQPYTGDLQRVQEYRQAIRMHHKKTASQALDALIDFVLTQVEQDQHQRLRPEGLLAQS